MIIEAARATEELTNLLTPEQVLSGPAAMRGYDCDAYTVDRFPPVAVILPYSTEEVAKVVTWCNSRAFPFTSRGAGTGLSGGALPALGGVVISTKKMTRILGFDIQNRTLRAQAGVVNKKITDAVREYGLHFAPDPSSQSVSTLGGNIAENSGGPHTLKYGVTSQHLLKVKMVSVDGEILEFGSDVGAGTGPDFVGLLTGAEGTLGVVTEALVKLTPLPRSVATVLAAFPTIADATNCVAQIIASGAIPAALEMMDKGILRAVKLAFDITYPDEAEALLLVECDSNLEEGADAVVEAEIGAVRSIALKYGAISFDLAQNEKERARLWMVRKKSIGAMGRLAPSIVTHDGVIPRSKLPEMLAFVYEVAEKQQIGVANMFHAGDGNLHPCFYFDDRDPSQVDRVVKAGEQIIERCIELGGSITGEHGIGVEKLDLMHLMFTPEDLALQQRAKEIFNGGVLCNPCKVLPNQKSCVEHKKRWRGVAW